MTKESKDAPLPGNHGQFGVNNASEDHKPLEEYPTPQPPSGTQESTETASKPKP